MSSSSTAQASHINLSARPEFTEAVADIDAKIANIEQELGSLSSMISEIPAPSSRLRSLLERFVVVLQSPLVTLSSIQSNFEQTTSSSAPYTAPDLPANLELTATGRTLNAADLRASLAQIPGASSSSATADLRASLKTATESTPSAAADLLASLEEKSSSSSGAAADLTATLEIPAPSTDSTDTAADLLASLERTIGNDESTASSASAKETKKESCEPLSSAADLLASLETLSEPTSSSAANLLAGLETLSEPPSSAAADLLASLAEMPSRALPETTAAADLVATLEEESTNTSSESAVADLLASLDEKSSSTLHETTSSVADLLASLEEKSTASSATADLLADLETTLPAAESTSTTAADLLANLEATATVPAFNAADLLASLEQTTAELSSATADLRASFDTDTKSTSSAAADLLASLEEKSSSTSGAAADLLATLETPAPTTDSTNTAAADLLASLERTIGNDESTPSSTEVEDSAKETGDASADDRIAPKPTVAPEIEFAEFLSNREKKKPNYARFGRVGGRKNKASKFSLEDLDASADFQQPQVTQQQTSVDTNDLLASLTSLRTSSVDGDGEGSPSQQKSEKASLNDLLASLGAAEKNEEAETTQLQNLQSPEESSAPLSLMEMFMPRNVDELTVASESLGTEAILLNIPPHQPDDPLIRDFAVRDDINKAGMRRAKKRPMTWGGSKKKAAQMEDTHFVSYPFTPDECTGLFCVFDGHVGKEAALAAREFMPMELTKHLEALDIASLDDSNDILMQTFESVDKQMAENYKYEGTTATGVLVWQAGEDRFVQSANVGDSLAYLSRNGVAVCLGEPHTVKEHTEQERMRASGIVVNPGQTRINGLAVSRALGDHFVKENNLGMIGTPFVCPPIKLEPTDTILIVASDGLWDVMDGQQAVNTILGEKTASAMASKLIRAALQSTKCNDNVTVVVAIL